MARCSRSWTAANRLNDSGAFPYLRSHPLTIERIRLALAQAALAQADASPALLRTRAESLQTWLAGRPADAAAWQSLAGLWQRLGHPLRAVRAEAEARYALGDWTGASDRLRAGQQAARRASPAEADAIESAVIDARLREVEALRRQQFLEERGQAPR
jgi:beta-barrel assembly-enhancing protease